MLGHCCSSGYHQSVLNSNKTVLCKQGQQSHLNQGGRKKRAWLPSFIQCDSWQEIPCLFCSLSHSTFNHAMRCSYRSTKSQSLIAVIWVLISVKCSYKLSQALLGFHLQANQFSSPEKEMITQLLVSDQQLSLMSPAICKGCVRCSLLQWQHWGASQWLPSQQCWNTPALSEAGNSPCCKEDHCMWLKEKGWPRTGKTNASMAHVGARNNPLLPELHLPPRTGCIQTQALHLCRAV